MSVIDLLFKTQCSFTPKELVEVIYEDGDNTGSDKCGLSEDIENCFQKFPQEHLVSPMQLVTH